MSKDVSHLPLKIVSMVTRADLRQDVDLNYLSKYIPDCIYEPEQFPALFYRVRTPRITFVIFASGKVMGYGGLRLEDVKHHFKKLASFLKPLGVTVMRVRLPEICMLVGSGTIAEPLDIETLAERLCIVYEPEQFPALIWRFDKGEVVLAFSSGKVVITGAKSVNRINQIYDEVVNVIRSAGALCVREAKDAKL